MLKVGEPVIPVCSLLVVVAEFGLTFTLEELELLEEAGKTVLDTKTDDDIGTWIC